MVKRMLIDATHPEETRVAVVSGNRLEEFDFETSTKKQLKGNIYLAKVTRVEPSLQAAFVDYGGNRHGFLAFSEIHPDYYRLPVSDREALLAEASRQHEEEDAETPEEPADADGDGSSAGKSKGRRRRKAGNGLDRAAAERAADETVSEDEDRSGEEAEADEPEEADEIEELAGADDIGETGEKDSPDDDSLDTIGDDELEAIRRRNRALSRRYRIQEVISRRQIMLVQVAKEERGNKGAALTTYISLAGRYCVLMPNTPRGGGISRKITNPADRKRLKTILESLDIPEGMAVIVRTAGMERTKPEIKRDYEYLMKLWDDIRERTLISTAPALINEEANLIRRSIRDLYSKDISEIVVEGEGGYKTAKNFMKMLMPSHAKRVIRYEDDGIPQFHRYQVEAQIDNIHSPVVQLKSGGYIVISSTEALVAIDVNSGRSTRERNIEETAYRTNLEAAEEVARQLRLRDLAGLIVIDFIDMEEHRNRKNVEKRLKEAMRADRARIQLGRISAFGLLEMSRQRLRPSLIEASTEVCPTCGGVGHVRSVESTALHILRAIEEEGTRRRSHRIRVFVATPVALYTLNQKRARLGEIERRYDLAVNIAHDDSLVPPAYRIERLAADGSREGEIIEGRSPEAGEREPSGAKRRRRRRQKEPAEAEAAGTDATAEAGLAGGGAEGAASAPEEEQNADERKPRRRGRRGGRRRRGRAEEAGQAGATESEAPAPEAEAADAAPSATQAAAEEGAAAAGEPCAPAPKKRGRRKSTKAAEAAAAKEESVEAAAPEAEAAQATAGDGDDAAGEAAKERPKKPRTTRRKAASPKKESGKAAAGNGRKRKPAKAAKTETTKARPEPKEPTEEKGAPAASAKPKPAEKPDGESPGDQTAGGAAKERRTGWWQRLVE